MNERPRPAALVLKVSITMLIAMVLGLTVAGSPFGGSPADEAEIESIGDRAVVSSSPSITPFPEYTKDPRQVPTAVAASDPVQLRIPALDVRADVIPVGIDESNGLEIPDDITEVGWYELGPAPGSPTGSAVLVAHRDGRIQGHGVFYSLGALNLDDPIIVTDEEGRQTRYRVIARESIPKKKLPVNDLFATDGSPRLTLITCGGYYDRDNGGYQDNVVVTAIPV